MPGGNAAKLTLYLLSLGDLPALGSTPTLMNQVIVISCPVFGSFHVFGSVKSRSFSTASQSSGLLSLRCNRTPLLLPGRLPSSTANSLSVLWTLPIFLPGILTSISLGWLDKLIILWFHKNRCYFAIFFLTNRTMSSRNLQTRVQGMPRSNSSLMSRMSTRLADRIREQRGLAITYRRRVSDQTPHRSNASYRKDLLGYGGRGAATGSVGTTRTGIRLKNYLTLPCQARLMPSPNLFPCASPVTPHGPPAWLEIKLREGKKRQIRHMTAAVGLPTLRLVRVGIGPIRLENLEPGRWRDLSSPEINLLNK